MRSIGYLGVVTLAFTATLAAGLRPPQNSPVPPPGGEFKAGQEVPAFALDRNGKEVDRLGETPWRTALQEYVGGVRPPHLVWDSERVYVTNNDGVTALDARTGKVLWQAKGPEDRLLLSGDLLLAAKGPVLSARNTKDGKEAFGLRLRTRAPDYEDPFSITEVTDLFLVQYLGGIWGGQASFLIDRKGNIRCQLPRQVVCGITSGKGRVFLTNTDVFLLSARDEITWSAQFDDNALIDWWFLGGEILQLPGGDLLAYRYCTDADWGVQLMRLNPSTGKVVWKGSCEGLGAEQEGEYSQKVQVAVEGPLIRVTSHGDGGSFWEILDLASGEQLFRQEED
jgi:outer membrane protein assembly factor BamB